MLVGDAHVHLHRVFDLDVLFETAAARGKALGAPLLLLLTECQGDRAFQALHPSGSSAPVPMNDAPARPHRFRMDATDEPTSLAAVAEGQASASAVLVAGRQLVSLEGIEVLALALEPDHPASATPDRVHPAEELVRIALEAGAAVVLPWGLGKWLGARGAQVAALASDPALREHPLFLLGDTAHRFWPWPRPRALRPPARVLAGSDLLPVAGVERRVARYGFRIEAPLDLRRPAWALLEALRARPAITTWGRREGIVSTAAEQLRFRRAAADS